jgi:hypothetical protein
VSGPQSVALLYPVDIKVTERREDLFAAMPIDDGRPKRTQGFGESDHVLQ